MNKLILMTMLMGCGNKRENKTLKPQADKQEQERVIEISREEGIKLEQQVIQVSATESSTQKDLQPKNTNTTEFNQEEVNQGKKLIEAGKIGDVKSIKELVQVNTNIINFIDANGWTALMHASRNGHLEVITALIEAGADVNIINKKGWTALMLSAYKGDIRSVNVLIKERAIVDAANEDQFTALMSAADKGHIEVIKALIKAGANFNLVNKNGLTALMWAAQKGNAEAVRVLISGGAKNIIDQSDKKGWTALIHASRNGHVEAIRALIEAGADVNKYDEDENTALIHASQYKHTQAAIELLKVPNIDVSHQNKAGETAIGWATNTQNVELTNCLLEKFETQS